MNAVEIEEAVTELAEAPFEAAEFPFRFLAAFGMKDVTLRRLRAGSSNASDVAGAVLQRNNIHLAVAEAGRVGATLAALRGSPRTISAKAKFVLATDGVTLEAEDVGSGEALACAYPDMARHFGFFLPLAGISTVKEIKNNPVDIKATGRLNKLYVELLKDNADWATEARRPALNRFMARLIFCFFAEDTGIFHPSDPFTATVERMSDAQAGNTHEIIGTLFRAMGTRTADRAAGDFRTWAAGFPYMNGALFTGDGECPRFSKIARAYLLSAGKLDWKEINPDIFGSMIQAVADDEERGALGMHYTSVPNILKVLNPLFLDELREQLAAAGDNARKLRNLRRRLAAIRVFDPACGSGNFLVIAYLHMRGIEHEIVRLTGDAPKSLIRLDNFYGIEIKGFAAEIARLALLIAEFQADCRYLSQQEARMMVLPLHRTGQIHIGNALRMDWLEVCPPVTKAVVEEHDLAGPTGRLALEANGLGDVREPETLICGNPPYKGSQSQGDKQKADLEIVFGDRLASTGALDYVSGWFAKARDYIAIASGKAAFVTTNSLNQGRQVALLWPLLLRDKFVIDFAHRSFKWTNLASYNAGVTVSIVGIASNDVGPRYLISDDMKRKAANISPYLVDGPNIYVVSRNAPISAVAAMSFGSMPNDGGGLLCTYSDATDAIERFDVDRAFIRPVLGSQEFIHGIERRCIWVADDKFGDANGNAWLRQRFQTVSRARNDSGRTATAGLGRVPYRFGEVRQSGAERIIVVPSVSSERREFLPIGYVPGGHIITNLAFGLYDAPLWNMALIASRIHLVWIATVCGKLKTDFRYSNTLGWNTFPVPPLTEQNKTDLTRCAENILLAREAHFPATIADLYDPDAMPENLRAAHEANDEMLERIYIGRRFRNDTERLEKLFELYVKMTANQPPAKKKAKRAA